MKHQLNAYFILSGELPPESKEDLDAFFIQFGEKIQQSKKEGKFDISWSLKKSELALKISSIDSISPHVAILRIRKQLAASIGKKYRVGLRGFKFKDYKITTEIEDQPIKEFTLPLTKKLTFSEKEGKNWVEIQIDPEISEDFVEKGTIERIVRRVSEKISKQKYGAKKEHHEIVFYSGEKKLFTKE
ncbi:MAG: hypothetical protein ACTSQF_08380, partial [Candidatus Heimdallarchaeaceae archaeon]